MVSISTLSIKQYKLVPTVTVLCTSNSACMNVHTKPFYLHENQYTKILNLPSPVNFLSLFQPEMACFGSKISCKTENHS